MIDIASPSFGPHLYGAQLHIDAIMPEPFLSDLVAIDVETDEKDNFVGAAICVSDKHIYYFSKLNQYLKNRIECVNLIGHNVKFDIKQLINWGVSLTSENLYFDTCLASYVQDTTKASHGLKELAKEYLGMEWPNYKEMVGTGRNKQTLDKQPIEHVAAYCGMDCLATYRLWQYFQKKLTVDQKRYLETIELPTARALLNIELLGVR